MATCAQRRRRPFSIRLRPCDQKPHGSDPDEKVGARACAQLVASIGTKRLRGRARTLAQSFERFTAVRLDHNTAETQLPVLELGVAANRRAARTVEHCKKRAFGGA